MIAFLQNPILVFLALFFTLAPLAKVLELIFVKSQRKKYLLSYHVQRALDEHRQGTDAERIQRLSAFLKTHNSSLWAFTVLMGGVVFLYVLAFWLGSFLTFTWFSADLVGGYLAVLWQVEASVLGITFVVVVFLMEAVVSRQTQTTIMWAYIRDSWIVTIAFWGLLSVGSLGVFLLPSVKPNLSDGQITALMTLTALIFGSNLFLAAVLYRRAFRLLRC